MFNKENRERIIELEIQHESEFNSTRVDGTLDENETKAREPTIELLIIGDIIVKFNDATRIERRSSTQAKTVCIPGGKISDILREVG